MPQKDTLDDVAYTCMLVSYHRHSPQFHFLCLLVLYSIYLNGTNSAARENVFCLSVQDSTLRLVYLRSLFFIGAILHAETVCTQALKELIPELLKRLQIRALIYRTW